MRFLCVTGLILCFGLGPALGQDGDADDVRKAL